MSRLKCWLFAIVLGTAICASGVTAGEPDDAPSTFVLYVRAVVPDLENRCGLSEKDACYAAGTAVGTTTWLNGVEYGLQWIRSEDAPTSETEDTSRAFALWAEGIGNDLENKLGLTEKVAARVIQIVIFTTIWLDDVEWGWHWLPFDAEE